VNITAENAISSGEKVTKKKKKPALVAQAYPEIRNFVGGKGPRRASGTDRQKKNEVSS